MNDMKKALWLGLPLAPMLLSISIAWAAGAVACGGANDNLPPPPPPPPPPPAPPPAPPAASSAAPPPAPPVTLTQGIASPDPAAPLPTVKILAPTKDQVIAPDKAADLAIKLDVK